MLVRLTSFQCILFNYMYISLSFSLSLSLFEYAVVAIEGPGEDEALDERATTLLNGATLEAMTAEEEDLQLFPDSCITAETEVASAPSVGEERDDAEEEDQEEICS